MTVTARLRKVSAIGCISLMLFASTGAGAGELPAAVTDADYYQNGAPGIAKVKLGQLLFWDKILSGNRNISCATCHHTLTDSADGLSLSVGEGARGQGVARDTGRGADAVHERVPRNSPAVFNLGAMSMTRMFHDGRLELDLTQASGFRSPAEDDLPLGLDNALAAQAMFPVTSATEMAGQAGENTIADAAAAKKLSGPNGVWALLAGRLRAISEYVELFTAAFHDINRSVDITFVHAANAIAAYEAVTFRADNSPFDRHVRGDQRALSDAAEQGMGLFYGKANCSRCHSGKFQTDMGFHAIAMPQIGPGKGEAMNGHDDLGRAAVTGDVRDRYRFRTPSLRNVALTGPWGHDGAYNSLRAVIEHHLDPETSLENYDRRQAVLPGRADLDVKDFVVYGDLARRAALAASNELPPLALDTDEVDDLVAFMHALTDVRTTDLSKAMPQRVPSGLPLAD